jgi:uncharacterized protein YbjT (DUF2867 family)
VGKTIFVAGCSGFIGGHLIEAFKRGTAEIRCLARNQARGVRFTEKGIDIVVGDLLNRESLKGCLDGVDLVIDLVGIIKEKGDFTFEKVHVAGTKNLVEEARRAGIKHIFYQSSLGASTDSSSHFLRTKAEAEEIVKTSGIEYTIFRPSVIVGERDGFTEKLKTLIQMGPVVPVPGDGNSRFQPIYVHDWARCLLIAADDVNAAGKTFEFGGPEQLTYNEIVTQLMDAMGMRKRIVHLPMSFARAGVPFVGLAQGLSRFLGRKIPPVTGEQLTLLGIDYICDPCSVENNFGFEPITYREALGKFITKN